MKNMLERLRAARAARQENGEAGFSLIELIVVIAIIGILIAIAIPVYGNIQNTAKQNQLKNAAATGASVWAANFASDGSVTAATALTASANDDYKLAVAVGPKASGTTLDLTTFCVTATAEAKKALDGATAEKSGPGC